MPPPRPPKIAKQSLLGIPLSASMPEHLRAIWRFLGLDGLAREIQLAV
jgi:hypothetical protein